MQDVEDIALPDLAKPHGMMTAQERAELIGGLRTVHWRLALAAFSGVLLYLAGDMVQWWPLCWVAWVPLALACRGAGAPGAFLVGFPVLLLANVAQSLWLLDGPDNPLYLWLAAALFPAMALFTVELPFVATRLPWVARPLIFGFLVVGAYSTLPNEGRMLLPFGGMIDSELTRAAYAKLGPASFAGLLGALAWLAAELFWLRRTRSVAIAFLVAMVLVAVTDSILAARQQPEEKREYGVRVVLIPGHRDLEEQTAQQFGPQGRGGLVVWGVQRAETEAQRQLLHLAAGRVSVRHHCILALVIAEPDFTSAWFFVYSNVPVAHQRWPGRPGQVDGPPLRMLGPGTLWLHPALMPSLDPTAEHDLQICTTASAPLHPAQSAYWLREQRRVALIRQTRQICVWDDGGAIIDHDGRLVAQSSGPPIAGILNVAPSLGEAMAKPRLTVLEDILKFTGPTFTLTFALLTVISWAKRRWRKRRQAAQEVALEEVYDGQ
ncbi:MAG: hypothetical protein IPP14_09270 [Planctomycetes bacterium]|nr:hypothetical protein [Planctomycetota bacterium]